MEALEKYAQSAFLNNISGVAAFVEQKENLTQLSVIAQEITRIFEQGNKILICGNGGSACDAMHFAEEFTGKYRNERRALPVISLTNVGHITCVANDWEYEEVFARGVQAYGQRGDMLIVLSTSGNSSNIYRAVEEGLVRQMQILALLGKKGGKVKGMAHRELIIPGNTPDRIQEIHMLILHTLIELVERIMFPKNYDQP